MLAAASTIAGAAALHRVEHAQRVRLDLPHLDGELGEPRRTKGSEPWPRSRDPGDHLLEVAAHALGRELDVALVGQRRAHQRPGAVLGADPLLDRDLDPVECHLVELIAVERRQRAHPHPRRAQVDDQAA